MGKNKQPRTKGNTRPSNSDRAAQLLANSGNLSSTPFLGFGVTLPSTSPEKLAQEVGEICLVAEFKQFMSKIEKKDAGTRLKVLQEFKTFCDEKCDAECTKGILPFWPRIFNKQALDYDRKIREGTFEAHRSLVLKAGRNLAPYLKQVIGVWLIGLCDPYPMARQAAQNGMDSAFNEEKQIEALRFCKDEILTVISTNLFKATSQSLSDSQQVSKEDMDAKYNRLVACSLGALSLFIRKLSRELADINDDVIKTVLSEAKFYKLSKHDCPMVRGEWCNVISVLCELCPDVTGAYIEKIFPGLVENLDSNDPFVSMAVWQAMLFVTSTYQSKVWKHISIKKAFLPKLWNLLKCGGHGSAHTVFPNLLPLLSKLPLDDAGLQIDRAAFYTSWFNHTRNGLVASYQSSAEAGAILNSFFECLKYVCVNLQEKNNSDDTAICRNLFQIELASLFKELIVSKQVQHQTLTKFGVLLADFLQFIQKKSTAEQALGYAGLLELFWVDFSTGAHNLLTDSSSDYSLNGLAHVLLCILSPEVYKRRKSNTERVKFSLSNDSEELACEVASEADFDGGDPFLNDAFLFAEVSKLCVRCVDLIKISNEINFFKYASFLSTLVPSYAKSNPSLIKEFLTSSGLVDFLLNERSPEYFTPKPEVVAFMGQMVLTEFELANGGSDERYELIKRFVEVKDSEFRFSVIEFLVSANASYGLRSVLRGDWFSDVVLEVFESCVRDLDVECGDGNAVGWQIVRRALNCDRGFVISNNNVKLILGICYNRLCEISTESSDMLANNHFEFVMQICRLPLITQEIPCTQEFEGISNLKMDMVYKLFVMSGTLSGVQDLLNSVWITSVGEAFQKCCWGTQPPYCIQLLNNCTDYIRKNHVTATNNTSLERIVRLTTNFFAACTNNCTKDAEDCEKKMFSLVGRLLLSYEESVEMIARISNQVVLVCFMVGSAPLLVDEALNITNFDFASMSELLNVAKFFYLLLKSLTDPEDESYPTCFGKKLPHYRVIVSLALTVVNKCELFSAIGCRGDRALLEEAELKLGNRVEVMAKIREGSVEFGGLYSVCSFDSKADESQESPSMDDISRIFKDPDELRMILTHGPDFVESDRLAIMNEMSSAIAAGEFELRTVRSSLLVLRRVLTVKDDVPSFVNTVCKSLLLRKDCYDLKVNVLSKVERLLFNVHLLDFLRVVLEFNRDVLRFRAFRDLAFLLVEAGLTTATVLPAEVTLQLKACSMVTAFHTNIIQLRADITKLTAEDKETLTEWDEFVVDAVFLPLLTVFVKFLKGRCKVPNTYPLGYFYRHWLCEAAANIPRKFLDKYNVDSFEIVASADDKKDRARLSKLVDLFSGALLDDSSVVQGRVQALLSLICSSIGKHCVKVEKIVDDKDKDNVRTSRVFPPCLIGVLEDSAESLTELAKSHKVGDNALFLKPAATDAKFVRAYLHCWNLFLEIIETTDVELRHEFVAAFGQNGYFDQLLDNLFRLMPVSTSAANQVISPGIFNQSVADMFSGGPTDVEPLKRDKDVTVVVQELACQVYFKAAKALPALLRQWFINQDRRVTTVVERFTSSYVSPLLCAQEFKAVQADQSKLTNMKVKTRPATREVLASYVIGDEVQGSMEIIIVLPENHPLGAVKVDSGKKAGISNQQWRNWTLQLTTFIMHKNGSLIDGLLLWKRNMDKKFEGVEECCICYFVVDSVTEELPRKTCRTCKKRFHAGCLYKWFTTSNKSTCPMCKSFF